MYCARIQDGSATRSTIGITRDLRSRERERNLEAKFDRKPRRVRNSSRVYRSRRELRRFERCGVFMAGHKNGWANGDIPCNRMSAPSRAFTRNFYFPCEKKSEAADGVEETGEERGMERRKTRGRRRRVGCLEIGVGKKGGGRKRHDKNNGLEQEEKEDGITRGTIVGRKIANKRRRGGWKRGEIRSERVGKI